MSALADRIADVLRKEFDIHAVRTLAGIPGDPLAAHVAEQVEQAIIGMTFTIRVAPLTNTSTTGFHIEDIEAQP